MDILLVFTLYMFSVIYSKLLCTLYAACMKVRSRLKVECMIDGETRLKRLCKFVYVCVCKASPKTE